MTELVLTNEVKDLFPIPNTNPPPVEIKVCDLKQSDVQVNINLKGLKQKKAKEEETKEE